MPSPTVSFRITRESFKNLKQVAKAYGAPHTVFIREAVASMCSGDMERVGKFLARLQSGAMKQMQLDLGRAQKRQNRRGRASPG